MARIGAPSLYTLLIIYSSFLLISQIHGRSLERRKLERAPITVEGLSYDYYARSCSSVETIVRRYLEQLFAEESAIGPGILRLFFMIASLRDVMPLYCYTVKLENCQLVITKGLGHMSLIPLRSFVVLFAHNVQGLSPALTSSFSQHAKPLAKK